MSEGESGWLGEHRVSIGVGALVTAGLPTPAAYLTAVAVGVSPTSPYLLALTFYGVVMLVIGLTLIGRLRKAFAVCAILGGAIGLAAIGAFIRPTGPSPATIQTIFVPGTVYTPGKFTGRLVGPITYAVAYAQGECNQHSALDSDESDAYSCTTIVNNRKYTLDPCFPVNPAGGAEAACFRSPWATITEANSTGQVQMAYAYGIKRVTAWNRRLGGIGYGWARPWGLQLTGNVVCVPSGGPAPGAPANEVYTCQNYQGQQTGFVVAGYPNETKATWTVNYQPVGQTVETAQVVEAFK